METCPAPRVARLLTTWLTPEKRSRLWLGVRFAREQEKLVIADVQPDSPAARAGLAAKDMVKQVDGEVFAESLKVQRHLLRKKEGDTVKCPVERAGNPWLTMHTLTSRTSWLRVGRQDDGAKHQAIVMRRHHSCEMMASYALEGLLDGVLAGPLREEWTFDVVPMVDLAGVEAGDQGKSRGPHDHNRDCTESPRYPEVAGIIDLAWRGDGRLRLAVDLHCPWVRGEHNEHIYIVGSEDAANAARQRALARGMEAARTGPLPYRADGTLPFGRAWNTTTGKPVSFGRWMAANAPRAPTVVSLELLSANAEGAPVTANSAHAFGRDLSRAIAAQWTTR